MHHQRDRAWDVFPFPCIGRYGFADLYINETASYESILDRLRRGATFVDLGCCFAQDVRKLVFDGVPDTQLCGVELEVEYIDLGYEFFVDKGKLQSKFMVADVFDIEGPLKELHGKMDIIQIGLFLHLFTWEDQKKALEHVVRISKPSQGSMVVGRQAGSSVPGEYPSKGTGSSYRHDVSSFERLWQEVEQTTGSRWNVRAELDMGLGVGDGKRKWDDPNSRRLYFEVVRIA